MKEGFKNIILLFISVAMCLYASEYFLGFYLTKSILHFPVPPHAEQKHVTVDYQVTYRYNNFSLRGADLELAEEYDGFFLGDSFFFGQGVGEGNSFSDILLQKGYKVLNASEIATNPIDYFHKLRILQSYHLKTRKVVVGFCTGNDFQDIGDKKINDALDYIYRPEFLRYNGSNFLRLERLRYQIRKKWIQLNDWVEGLYSGRSYLETVVVHDFEHRKKFYPDWIQFFSNNRPDIMKTMQGYDQKPFTDVNMTEDEYLQKLQINDDSLKNTLKILNTFCEISRPARVYVVLIPDPYYVFGFQSVKYQDFLHRLVKGLDPSITVIDLHGLTTREMHYLHDGHWNLKGHKFVADIIAHRVLFRD